MHGKRTAMLVLWMSCIARAHQAEAQTQPKPVSSGRAAAACRRAVFEGTVNAGQGFEKVFASGLKFYLEPLRSGWIVRVLAANTPREPHDLAELATPPYRSVNPLLISTDWSFRAQDALGWNPRRFRYAASRADFVRLESLYGRVIANDMGAMTQAGKVVAAQPEGMLTVLDSRMVPGIADQAGTAATVASHFATTPHSVDQSMQPTPLGVIEAFRFRVELDLAPGVRVTKGLIEEQMPCAARPTGRSTTASEQGSK